MNTKTRSRRTLLLVGLCFAAPMLASLVLTQMGWMPSGRKNYGELLSTPHRLINTQTQDGDSFAWKTPEWYWTLIVRVPKECAGDCAEQLDLVANLREALAQNATKLRIAVADPMSDDARLTGRSGVYLLAQPLDVSVSQGLPLPEQSPRLALVDPNGYIILRYPEAADLSRVRRDLAKLLK